MDLCNFVTRNTWVGTCKYNERQSTKLHFEVGIKNNELKNNMMCCFQTNKHLK